MKPTKVLIYAAVLLCLAGWLYFYEIKHKEKIKAASDKAEKIVSLSKESVTGFELKPKEGTVIELVKPADQWVISAPIRSKADDHATDSLLHSITTGKREKLLKEKDVNWAEYGLDKPELTLILKTKEKSHRIAFGEKNPSKSSVYVRVDDNPELLLVADTLKNSVNKSVFDLRDKTVVAIAPDDVDRFVIEEADSKLALEREGADAWNITEPEKMKAKKSVVNGALRTLTSLTAKNIIDEPEKEGDRYGFEKPELTLEFTGKKLGQTLLIGGPVDKPSEDDKGAPGATPSLSPDRYARIKGRTPVFVVEGATIKNLKKRAEDYRDKSLLSFEPTHIEKLSVMLDGATYTASIDKDKSWNLESPKKAKAESWAITGLLWTIRDLEWKTMTKDAAASPSESAQFGLDNPKLTVTLTPKGEGAQPLLLKAAWPDPPQKASDDKEQPSEKKTEEASAPKPEEGKAPESKPDGGTAKKAKDTPAPTTVFAVAEPSEHKDAVYVLDGAFVKRLRDEFARLTADKDKKEGKGKK
jgi:cell division septation protein DedD